MLNIEITEIIIHADNSRDLKKKVQKKYQKKYQIMSVFWVYDQCILYLIITYFHNYYYLA